MSAVATASSAHPIGTSEHYTSPYEQSCLDKEPDRNSALSFGSERWRQAFGKAEPTLVTDLRSRRAFDSFISDAISYGMGQTPIVPELNSTALTRTPELKALRDATSSLMWQGRAMSQSGMIEEGQLDHTAAGLRKDWRMIMHELEPSKAALDKGERKTPRHLRR